MNEPAPKYEGMDRYECRKAWVARSWKRQAISLRQRKKSSLWENATGAILTVEPMLSDQWFVKPWKSLQSLL